MDIVITFDLMKENLLLLFIMYFVDLYYLFRTKNLDILYIRDT